MSPLFAPRCPRREVDTTLKRWLRSPFLVPSLLALVWVGVAAILGFAPVTHANTHFGWHMLNGEILTGALGLGVAGEEGRGE